MTARIFLALLRRDAVVAKRDVVGIMIRTMLNPLLFTFVFGYLLIRIGMFPVKYATMIIPGIAGLSLTMASIWAVAMPLIADFGFTKEIEDRLLAPVPMEVIAVEKLVAGILQGALTAMVVLPLARLIIGPIPGLTLQHLPLLALMVILSGAVFSALGLFLGTAMQPQHISLMMQVIFAPMIMFGCTYYPWRGLDAFPVLKYLVLINPLVYVSEGLRAAITPSVPHMPVAVILSALVAITLLLLWLGMRGFRRRAVS
jgi:ABC-2 type transport system permease protein